MRPRPLPLAIMSLLIRVSCPFAPMPISYGSSVAEMLIPKFLRPGMVMRRLSGMVESFMESARKL